MARKEIRIPLDRENRNDVNSNFKELYDQLHDITGTITDEIIQEILDEALENSKLVWKEFVDTFDELPDDAGLGEVHYVVEEKTFYRWDGEEWTPIQQIDMDVMTEMEERLELLISSNTESVDELRVDVNLISEDVSATKEDIDELVRNKANRSELDDKVGKDELEDLLPDVEFKGVLLALNNNIKISTNSWEIVSWNKAEYNYSGFWSSTKPSRIVIPAGVKKVRLNAGTLWESNSDGSRRIRMRKNGQYSAGLVYISSRAGGTSPTGGTSSVVEVREGDYFEMEVYQSSGEDRNLRSDPYTFFGLEVVEYSKK